MVCSLGVTRLCSFWVKLSCREVALPRVSTGHVEVWLPRLTHILGLLGNGIISSVIAGVRFLQRAIILKSATSGKAGGLKKVEPLKADRCCEPLKAVRL